MTKYILIQNDGEIESNSFELIGASTKRNDSTKIGFFGSGLKYSIAFMMRKNISFKIYSGLKELVFTTIPESLKEQSFDRICINGKPTSYTTTMGPTWEKEWFVLREIYCNALDEGSCQLVKSTENIQPSEGKTRIYIELTETLQSVIDDWDSYFSDERETLFVTQPVYTSYLDDKVHNQSVKVYKKTNGAIFRKGVKVAEKEDMLYDYEFEHISINEDRTAKNSVAVGYATSAMALCFENEQWLINVLRNEESKEYKSLRTDKAYHVTGSDKWVEFSKNYMLVVKEISGRFAEKIAESKREVFLIPEYFARQVKTEVPDVLINGMGRVIGDASMDEINKTPKMEFLLKEVQASLREMGYEVIYDINVVSFQEENVLGKADIKSKQIYVSDKVFQMGRRELALVLMEESEHIKSQAEDETREFQNHLFSKWLSYMEDKNGLFL